MFLFFYCKILKDGRLFTTHYFTILLLKEGIFNTVPTMIGTTKDEGLLSSAQYHANPDLYRGIYYRTVSP